MAREIAMGKRVQATAARRRCAVIAALTVAVAAAGLLPAGAAAQGAQSPLLSSTFGLSGSVGLVLPGTITVESLDVDTRSGFLLQAAADYYVVPRLAVGLYVQYQSVGLEGVSGDASIIGLGPTLKARFPIGEKFLLRPSLSIGYQHGSWSGSTESTGGLGIGLQVEGVIPFAREANGLVQIGFSTQPSGGNSSVDLTWGPIFYLAVGVEYAK